MENHFESLYLNIRSVLIEARKRTYRVVNATIIESYWQIGYMIVEDEQNGQNRATYGKQVLAYLSKKLTVDFGDGFDERNLRYMRAFYQALLVSLLLIISQALAFWLVMLGCGLRFSFWVGAAVYLIVHLGTAAPIAPANVGSYQFFTVIGLTLFGVDKAAATAFSLVVFVLLTLPLLLLGFAALSTSGTSLGQLRREVRQLAKGGTSES